MSVVRTCKQCGLKREHRRRGDSESFRSSCNECQAAYGRRWRNENWQRRKAYDTWKGMIARCYDRSTLRWCPGTGVPSYRDYGALGITVCRRWLDEGNGFQNFVEDLGWPPNRDSTLDRIRPSRGYTQSNTRWTDKETQNQNRKNTVWVTARHPYTGAVLTLCLSEWGRQTRIDRRVISSRLARGWKPDRAISEPTPSSLELQSVPF